MYTYGWFMLRFDRKQENSVNNYPSIKKNKLKMNTEEFNSKRNLTLKNSISDVTVFPNWNSVWIVFLRAISIRTVKCYSY